MVTLIKKVYFYFTEVTFICIDVANGYSQFFVEYVKKVRDKFPRHTIMVNEYFYDVT